MSEQFSAARKSNFTISMLLCRWSFDEGGSGARR